MIDYLTGPGCRLGELLALDWNTAVDFAAGTVTFKGTVIRATGKSLFVQEHTKSTAGMRTVQPPRWVMAVLRERYDSAGSSWVFPSSSGTLRDVDDTRRRLPQMVAGTTCEGLHPHDFRHYVAGGFGRVGLSAREIADYLGHELVSMTQDVYMSRKAVGGNVAAVLSQIAASDGSQKVQYRSNHHNEDQGSKP